MEREDNAWGEGRAKEGAIRDFSSSVALNRRAESNHLIRRACVATEAAYIREPRKRRDFSSRRENIAGGYKRYRFESIKC